MVVGMALVLGLRDSLKILVRTQGQLVGCRDGTVLAQGFGVRVTVGRRVCLKAHV